MKRLLVIRFSALGDVAMLVPVVRALAEQYPELQITVLSQQRMADLFIGLPDNVIFHGVDLKQQSLRTIVQQLGSFDLVADMHGVLRSVYIRTALFLRGASVRAIRKGRFDKFLLTHHLVHKPLKNSILRYVDVLQSLGLPVNMPDNTLHEGGKGIGMAPFAAHRGKRVALEQMERVVEMLSQRGEQIVLFGSEEEATILNSWTDKYAHVESFAGNKTLAEQLERMHSLRVMLTMDSANMHLASLVGTRVVSIWGATHPYAGFLGFGQHESDCIQKDMPCRPCSVYGKTKCQYGDYRCLTFSPEEIVARIV